MSIIFIRTTMISNELVVQISNSPIIAKKSANRLIKSIKLMRIIGAILTVLSTDWASRGLVEA